MLFPISKDFSWNGIFERKSYLVLKISFFYSLTSRKSPGGKHVTITVRETKTERMKPVNHSYSGEN